MASVLVVYGSTHGQTALIARNLAAHLRTAGLEVVVYDVAALPRKLDVAVYDAVVLGGRVHGGRHPRKLVEFARRNAGKLREMPSAFFSVSLVIARADGTGVKEAEGIVTRFIEETGWMPPITATFAGALKYTKYNFILRWIMKRISRAEGGSIDTSRDHDYTDWAAVRRFGEQLAAAVQPPIRPRAAGQDAQSSV